MRPSLAWQRGDRRGLSPLLRLAGLSLALALTAAPAAGSSLKTSGTQSFVGNTSQMQRISLLVQNVVPKRLTKLDVRDRCPGGPVSHDVFSFRASNAIKLPPGGHFIGTSTRRSGHGGITTIRVSGSFVQMAFSGSLTITRYASSSAPAACTTGPVTFRTLAPTTPTTSPITPIPPGTFDGKPTVSAPYILNYR